jgi:hypothetical protein
MERGRTSLIKNEEFNGITDEAPQFSPLGKQKLNDWKRLTPKVHI